MPLHSQDSIPARILRQAESELVRTGASGGVIAVIMGDRVLRAALGFVDTARTRPVRPDMLFGTGSLAEMYSSLVATVLAAQGRVDLDAPIRTWASDLPPGIGALTLSQILTHTAGLDDARDEPPRRGPGPTVWPGATDRALFTEPGAIHSPSRHGFPLAHNILAAATGRAWGTLLREVLLDPAGMSRTTTNAARAEALGAVPGLLVNNTAAGPLRTLRPTESPVAQVHATAEDIARLIRIGFSDGMDGARRLLPADAFAMIQAPGAARPAAPHDSVGMGVRITAYHGWRQVLHESSLGGYGTLVRWIPDAGVGVVALGNGTGAVLHGTADAALRWALTERGLGMANGPADPAEPLSRSADSTGATADSADASGAVGDPASRPDANPTSTLSAHDARTVAGTYANGDRIIVLEWDDGLFWRDGDLRLRVARRGPWLDVLVGDGRVAQSLRMFRDDAGRAYVIVEDLAYRRR